MNSFFSPESVRTGTTKIKNASFKYAFYNNYFDFVPVRDLSKYKKWKKMKSKDFKDLKIICKPDLSQDMLMEATITDSYLSHNNSLHCYCKDYFIHLNEARIDALVFSGRSINQLVQNESFRRKLEKEKDSLKCSIVQAIHLMDKECDVSTVTYLDRSSPRTELSYKSYINFHFMTPLSYDEAKTVYDDFLLLVQFLFYRRDVYLECLTGEIVDGDHLKYNGSLNNTTIKAENADKISTPISLESIFPIIEKLLTFVHEKKIVPLFIPSEKVVTFSDSYILATGWSQMVFKQVFVPLNSTYSIGGFTVFDNSGLQRRKVPFADQLAEMISYSFPIIQDFGSISLPFLISRININDYITSELPRRLKTVRNAIAHGSDRPEDYNYTQIDMVILLCAIYTSILKKAFNLDDNHLKLALAELFFDYEEAYSQSAKV